MEEKIKFYIDCAEDGEMNGTFCGSIQEVAALLALAANKEKDVRTAMLLAVGLYLKQSGEENLGVAVGTIALSYYDKQKVDG